MIQAINMKILLILGIILISGSIFAREFNMISNIDPKISVETYKKMGITQGWFHCTLPVELDSLGNTVWSNNKGFKQIQTIYKKFENSGILIFLVAGIWRTAFKGKADATQKNIYGQEWFYGSFSANTKTIEKKLQFLVKELKKYQCFGGICIDDEPAVIAGGCFNDRTIRLFKQKYELEAPTVKDFVNVKPGLVSSNNLVLLWMRFQRKLIFDFYKKLLVAVREVNQTCPVYTIPAASWICGKTISCAGRAPDKNKMKRLGTLDYVYMKDFHLYNQYCFSILDENGWSQKIADGLCQFQFTPPNCPRNIVPIYSPDPNGKGISPQAFKRYVLQTYAEGSQGIGYWPASVFSKNIITAAEDIYKNTIEPLCRNTPKLEKLKGKVAILVSTSTIDFASIWQNNPIERFKHIHESEALGYYLLKRGIPFSVVLENEIHNLDDYKIIIAAGIRYMRSDKAKILADYVAKGGKLIFNKSVKISIEGADVIDFDTKYWFETLVEQYQRESDLEYQSGLIDGILKKYIPDSLAICRADLRQVNINYLTDGENIYLLIVNNDLNGKVKTNLKFNKKYDIENVLTKKTFSAIDSFPLELEIGSLKAFKIMNRGEHRKNISLLR